MFEFNEENLIKIKNARVNLEKELEKIIVGQKQVIEEIIISLFSRGHVLLVGVPGLAKTLMINSIARILDLKFNRIQFTPDLMPSDITGTDIIEEDAGTRQRNFKFIEGPVFCNLLLADEINRTPPKTQAALLESMQENIVTVNGKTYDLPLPFFVLATQNPIEQEGTYPLPEAQLDRFMFNITIDYPEFVDEINIVKNTTSNYDADLKTVLTAAEISEIQKLIRSVPVADPIMEYAVKLVRNTRPVVSEFEFIKKWVNWGAGPRASQYLVLGAKTRAVLQGRTTVSIEDINTVAYPVLRHRILTNFQAEADGVNSDMIISDMIKGMN